MKISQINRELKSLGDFPHLDPAVYPYLDADQRQYVNTLRVRIEKLKLRKAKIIQRIGRKIADLRALMIQRNETDEFVRFRFAGAPFSVTVLRGGRRVSVFVPKEECKRRGWPEGGVYCQNEDKRERFIDEMLEEVRARA